MWHDAWLGWQANSFNETCNSTRKGWWDDSNDHNNRKRRNSHSGSFFDSAFENAPSRCCSSSSPDHNAIKAACSESFVHCKKVKSEVGTRATECHIGSMAHASSREASLSPVCSKITGTKQAQSSLIPNSTPMSLLEYAYRAWCKANGTDRLDCSAESDEDSELGAISCWHAYLSESNCGTGFMRCNKNKEEVGAAAADPHTESMANAASRKASMSVCGAMAAGTGSKQSESGLIPDMSTCSTPTSLLEYAYRAWLKAKGTDHTDCSAESDEDSELGKISCWPACLSDSDFDMGPYLCDFDVSPQHFTGGTPAPRHSDIASPGSYAGASHSVLNFRSSRG